MLNFQMPHIFMMVEYQNFPANINAEAEVVIPLAQFSFFVEFHFCVEIC